MRKSFYLLNIAIILSFGSLAYSIGEGLGPMAPAMDMPGQPGASDRSRQPEYRPRDGQDPQIQTAVEDIKAKLTKVITLVNEVNSPSQTELSEIESSIKGNLKYANRMDTTGKCYFHTLAAWYNYFNGQPKKARAEAMAAFQADKTEVNARITLLAMSLVNDDTRSLKAAATMTKPQNAQSGAFNDPAQAQMPQSQLGVTFNFNADSLIPDMLGTKIAQIDAKCINSTSFAFSGGKTLFALVWNLASVGEAGATAEQNQGMGMMPGMPGMGYGASSGQQLSPTQAFSAVFQKHFASPNMVFLGVNADEADQSTKVMVVLMKNSWPWAQAMAKDAANSSLASLAKIKISSPMLVVASSEGTIIYAGSPSGVLPMMLAERASRMSGGEGKLEAAAQAYAKKNGKEAKTEDANTAESKVETSPAPVVTEANQVQSAPAETQQVPAANEVQVQPKKQLSEEETFNPQAINLYENAKAQMKTAKYTSYGNVVRMCRQILQEYPETPEAGKARLLLREIPPAKRTQYKITNEEMGL